MYRNNFESLKNWFVEKAITQDEIADKLELSKSYISLLLSGKRDVTWKLALKIHKAYGVNPDWLMRANGSMFIKDYVPSAEKNAETEQIDSKEHLEKLKLWLSENKIKNEDIAMQTGMSISYIMMIWSGKRDITWNFAKKLEECFGINSDWLMKGEGEMLLKDSVPLYALRPSVEQQVQDEKPTDGSLDYYKQLAQQQATTIQQQQKLIDLLQRQIDRMEKLLGGETDGNE